MILDHDGGQHLNVDKRGFSLKWRVATIRVTLQNDQCLGTPCIDLQNPKLMAMDDLSALPKIRAGCTILC